MSETREQCMLMRALSKIAIQTGVTFDLFLI